MAQEQISQGVDEFVTEGTMVAVELCFPGQTVPPPAGQTAINCMQLDPDQTVYCGTTGPKAK